MDLRAYYKNLRDLEIKIPDQYVVVISLDTPDGGRPGTRSEVSREVAARVIAEGRARLASDEESHQFHEKQAELRLEAEARLAAQRMQVTIVPQTIVPQGATLQADSRLKPVRSSKE